MELLRGESRLPGPNVGQLYWWKPVQEASLRYTNRRSSEGGLRGQSEDECREILPHMNYVRRGVLCPYERYDCTRLRDELRCDAVYGCEHDLKM